jgi:sulfur-oxidizing protein SoxY
MFDEPTEYKLPPTTRRAALGLFASIGLTSFVGKVWAAVAPGWPAAAFKQKNKDDAVHALYGKPLTVSDKVSLEVPEIAENGAVVPVTVSSTLPKVTSITILVEKNPFTIASSYKLPEGTLPSISCRLKMAKTTSVVGIVESDGKLYSTSKIVKVTLGGCGG